MLMQIRGQVSDTREKLDVAKRSEQTLELQIKDNNALNKELLFNTNIEGTKLQQLKDE